MRIIVYDKLAMLKGKLFLANKTDAVMFEPENSGVSG